jgi:signal peptidase II
MRRRFLAAVAVALATSGCDLSTKYWAIQTTAHGARPLIPGALDLVHAENPGMAFSLMRHWPAHLRTYLLVGAALCFVIASLVVLTRHRLSKLSTMGLGLAMGGALGNLVDRVHGGTVTDFLYVHRGAFSWPVFNVADVAVSCGAFLLLFAVRKEALSRDALGAPRRRA